MNGVIYARYSSDNQREESIEGQIRECKAFAERNDIRIVGEYIDRAKSATTANRPDFQRMIADSNKNGFDVVIVWKLDRFARNRYDSAHYKAQLRKNGVKVISATETISEGAEGVLLESVLEGMAEYYSKELAEKTLRGMTDNALQCKSNGGLLPIGYTTDSELHYQIDPEMSPIVVEAFELYSEGATMKEIVDIFNSCGIRTKRGKAITINAVTSMLHNRKYIGEYRFKDVVIPNGIPAIISEELFDKVQTRMATNKKAPAKHKSEDEYLLTTKLYCGKCKCLMAGDSGTSRTGTKYRYYKCPSVKYHRGCDKKNIKKEFIEDLVIKRIMATIFDNECIDRLVEAVLKLQEQDNSVIPVLQGQLNDVEKGIENLVNAIQMGIISPSTKQRLDDLERQKRDLLAAISKEELAKPKLTEEQIRFWFDKYKGLDTSKIENKRKLIDTFVNAIYLYDNKFILILNYKDSTQTVTFSDIENSAFSADLTCLGEPKESSYAVRTFSFFVVNRRRLLTGSFATARCAR